MAKKQLTKNQLEELRNCFKFVDKDNSGFISTSELKKILDLLDINASASETKKLMDLMDKDCSGQIDFNEFVDFVADQFYKKPSKKELKDAFGYFDTDASGFITESELFAAISKFKGSLTKDEASRILKSIDKDGDGKINIDEFISVILSN